MSVVETNSTEAPRSEGDQAVDALFDALDRMGMPRGYLGQIVEGAIYIEPVQPTGQQISHSIAEQLRTKYRKKSPTPDRRINLPGHMNGFVPDVMAIRETAAPGPNGRWRYQDIDLVAEVASRSTAYYDYDPKKTTYAGAEIPLYLIADPTTGKCHLFSHPEDGRYRRQLSVEFGLEIDLTDTAVGLILHTESFPRC